MDGDSTQKRMTVSLIKSNKMVNKMQVDKIRVLKKDKSIVAYDRNKIITSLKKACYKRPISAKQIQKVTDNVEGDIVRNFESEVASTFIAESVMRYLRIIDKVAYIRFASVYRGFKDTVQLFSEVRKEIRDSGKLDYLSEAIPANSNHATEQVELVINLADDITYEEVTSLLRALEGLSLYIAGVEPYLNEIQIGMHTEERVACEEGN